MTSCLTPGLEPLITHYDAFVLDQYGCLHDGHAPYPGVPNLLSALKQSGKPVLILSNSGKSANFNRARLKRFGLDETVFDQIVTSGEFARSGALAQYVHRFGNRIFRITGDEEDPTDFGSVSDMVVACPKPQQADFALISGLPRDWNDERQERLLSMMLMRSLTLVCTNPDVVSPRPDGLIKSPGGIALAYENIGGRVEWIGKPRPEIYHLCFEALPQIAPRNILFVGDSYDHDVVGAAGVGGATMLLLGGILRAAFIDTPSESWPARVDNNLVRDGIKPTWISWGLSE